MSLNDTPRADRLHIGIFGKRNSGKSSLINSLTGQDIAIVSDTPGTTADPVYKSMELNPVGPVVFIDTAGFDDEGELGRLRVERTYEALDKTDIAVLVIDSADFARGDLFWELHWASLFEEKNTPVIVVLNEKNNDEPLLSENQDVNREGQEANCVAAESEASGFIAADCTDSGEGSGLEKYPIVELNVKTLTGIEGLRKAIEQAVPEDFLRRRILGDMAPEGSLVLLVMPQDIQAPKGRLILPQVQTLRELLDRRCTAVSTTANGFKRTLGMLNRAPDLIITDSQCFREVWNAKPVKSRLTSFSILFAAYKGDIGIFAEGASALDDMTENSKVLIAEACTHVPLSEDIGRKKIPAMLRKKFGESISIANISGNDFPDTEGLKKFDLVIHCGACMFNRKHVMSRIAAAQKAGVPITNYGIAIAKLTEILEKIEI